MAAALKLQLNFNPSFQRELRPDDRRLWLLRAVALRIELGATPLWAFEIYWRRLLIACTVLALAGYLSLVSGLYWWWARQPGNQVGWRDIALAPVRWDELRRKRGDTAVKGALERLQKGDYADAYFGLNVGLARSPGNIEGRLMLARLIGGSDPAAALRTLEDGLKYSSDETLLRALFGFYTQYNARTRALETVRSLLAAGHAPGLSPDGRFFVGTMQVILLQDTGRLTEAEAALASLPAPTNANDEGVRHRLKAQLLLKSGKATEAREYFARRPERELQPEDWQLYGQIALALHDAELFRSAVRHLKVSTDSAAPYLVAFKGWQELKRVNERDAVEREYYSLFQRNDTALQAFAALQVALDLPDVLRRTEQVAMAGGLSPFAFRVHRTELALRRGEFAEALQQAREWEKAIDTLKPVQRFYPVFISRLARASFGDEQQSTQLLAHLAAGRGQAQPSTYRLAWQTLERAGQPATAAQVVQTGLRFYPYDDGLLDEQPRLQKLAEAAAPKVSIPEAVHVAESSPALANALAEVEKPDELAPFATDAATALAAVDRWMTERKADEAGRFLIYLRQKNPAWLPEVRTDLMAREVQVRLALDQRSLAFTSLKELALRSGTPRAAAFKLVRDYAAQGERDRALLLAKELARLLPDEPAAAKLLKEIEASQPTGA